MSDNKVSRTGIGFGGALQLVFLVLKLTKVIQWSWWWVLAPTWIPLAIGLITFIVCICIAFFNKR